MNLSLPWNEVPQNVENSSCCWQWQCGGLSPSPWCRHHVVLLLDPSGTLQVSFSDSNLADLPVYLLTCYLVFWLLLLLLLYGSGVLLILMVRNPFSVWWVPIEPKIKKKSPRLVHTLFLSQPGRHTWGLIIQCFEPPHVPVKCPRHREGASPENSTPGSKTP